MGLAVHGFSEEEIHNKNNGQHHAVRSVAPPPGGQPPPVQRSSWHRLLRPAVAQAQLHDPSASPPPPLKPFATRLVGGDLSVGMLEQAARREIYDELVQAGLAVYIAAHPSTFDVIVASDTLVYQGRLEETLLWRPRRSNPAAACFSPWSTYPTIEVVSRTG